jgi:hypothetical protein
MKRSLSSLLLSVLFVSAAFAKTYSDKTVLAGRTASSRTAVQLTTWHNQIKEGHEERIGGSFSATGFYGASTNKRNLAKYFGTVNSNANNVLQDFIWVDALGATAQLNGMDIIHDDQGLPAAVISTVLVRRDDTAVDKLQFNPNQSRWGVDLAYNQDLDRLLKGLSFRVSMAVESARTSMDLKSLVTPVASPVAATATVAGFLAGKQMGAGQDVLAFGRMDATGHSKAGVADINATLQYQVWEQDDHSVALNAGVVIPTGVKPDAVWRFEPRVGDVHWGLGAGLDTRFRLWNGEEERSLDLLVTANYRYLFAANETRLPAQKFVSFYEYGLVGTVGSKGVRPAANVLAQAFKVTPGHQLDANALASLGLGNFTLDAGYNLYYRTAEKATRVNAWKDDLYSYADYGYNPAADYTTGDSKGDEWKLTAASIDWNSVETPAQLTHTVLGAVGYAFSEMETPVHLGLGGSYEFASDNAAVAGWAVWGKVGVSF